jgi:hypothetical protein
MSKFSQVVLSLVLVLAVGCAEQKGAKKDDKKADDKKADAKASPQE